MNTPCCSAAAITSWPLGAVISFPLTVSVTTSSATGHRLWSVVGQPGHGDGRLDGPTYVGLEFVTEATDGRRDRRHRGRAERADRGLSRRPVDARADVVAHVEQQVDVLGPALTIDDATQDLLEPAGAFATGRALPARFLGEEAHDAMTRADDVRVLVHDDDGS